MGYWIDLALSINLSLARLPNSFAQFVLDYGMDHIISTILVLTDVLKIAKGKMAEKKGKETCFYCQVSHWKRPTWSQRIKWHVMRHHLQVFMSLRFILFLLTKYRYMIPVLAHTYGLRCGA